MTTANEASTLTIVVNGEARVVPVASNVAQLLQTLGMADRRVAVERNLEIVPRSQYEVVQLQPDDRLEIVQAIGGG